MKLLKSCFIILSMTMCSVLFAHENHGAYHLTYKNKSLHVHAAFTKGPNVMDESVLLLETLDGKTHKNIEIKDNIEVSLWMPSMNHGSSPTQLERVMDQNQNSVIGKYLVKSMYFTMPGLWEVRVALTDEFGKVEVKKFQVQIKSDGSGHDHDHLLP